MQVSEIILAIVLLLPCAVLFLEVALAFLSRHQKSNKLSEPLDDRYKRVILMPAHNEALVIGTALSTVQSQMWPTDRLVVVADNCTDSTAAIAQKAGATVIFRHNEQQRGKGYALDFGLQYLCQDPPDVVIMVDADCRVQPGAIDAISHTVQKTNSPVQATYLLEQGENPSPKEMISTFAFKVKNLVRPLGMHRLGYPCLLTGSGMAFPWSIIQKMNLANDNIVEDMKLGLDLAIDGHVPTMCSDGIVIGKQPKQSAAAIVQRTRWEHGHLKILFSSVPRLLWEGLQQRRLDLVALALDVSIPPLALLVTLWTIISVSETGLTLFTGGSWLPPVIVYGAGLNLMLAISLAWYGFSRSEIPARKLLYIPLYVLWKVPLYFKFLLSPENKWVRTEREPSEPVGESSQTIV
ncbi:MAG: glycosyltransferase family 2 protein [Cyanobacteria bacterium J06628_4]